MRRCLKKMKKRAIYKVGIIGCGRVAGLLEDDRLRNYPCTHMGGYNAHPRVEVVACCSTMAEDARSFADKFSIARTYTDYEQMLAHEDLDIVSITAYAPMRSEMTIAAARSGVQAIFCEKAMATSLAEADAMISCCHEQGVLLCVNHTRRWDHHYMSVQDMIEQGAIGTVRSMSGTFSGNLLHTGIHMFDALVYFGGRLKAIAGEIIENEDACDEASGYRFSTDDSEKTGEEINDKDGIATLFFENGIIGHVLGIGKKYFTFEIDIHGSTGRIRIGNGLFEYWQMQPSKNYSDFRELALISKTVPGSRAPGMVLAIEDIVNALDTGSPVRCSGLDARASLECALAVYASSERGGNKIVLPLKDNTVRVVSR
jgi:predicted dehydrogenase